MWNALPYNVEPEMLKYIYIVFAVLHLFTSQLYLTSLVASAAAIRDPFWVQMGVGFGVGFAAEKEGKRSETSHF